jgi:thymidylate synthase ThyX
MSYKCEILADSKNIQGDRITTMKITFPRFILAEFNTHRMFSRNSASSRAIPFNKMVKMVEENPFIPIAWQKDHKGMQGTEYFTNRDDLYNNEFAWLEAKNNALLAAKELHDSGVTKQLCNRLLEPFMWHTVIVTSGKEGLDNFYKLRCPEYTIDLDDLESLK